MKEEEIERRISTYHSKYGVRLDSTFLTMIEIIKDGVVEDLKTQDRPVYQMANTKQAFMYGLGKHIWAPVTVVCLSALILVWYFFVSDNYRFREASIKNLSREQQIGLETFKGLITNTWGTGRISTFTPPGTNKPLDVLLIPKSSVNQLTTAGMSYYEDSTNIYIRIK